MSITRGQFMNKIAMDAFNDEFAKLAADAVVEENKSAVTPTKDLWSSIKGIGKSIGDLYSVKQLHDGLIRRKAFGHSVRAIDEMVKQDPDQEKVIRELYKDYTDAYDNANKDVRVGALKNVGAYGIPVAGTIGGIMLAKKMKERKDKKDKGVKNV